MPPTCNPITPTKMPDPPVTCLQKLGRAMLRIPVSAGSLCLVAVTALTCVSATGQDRVAKMPEKHVGVFKQYCFDCHDSNSEELGVNLQTIPLEISADIETAERWQKVLNAINSGEMPPADSPPIGDADKSAFLEDLSKQMVVARKVLSDSGGVITLRRLNRREYGNTIESLLGVHPDVSTLPVDQAGAGFDTAGASLFFSSDQLEQYLATARRTLELALAPPTTAKMTSVRIEPEDEYTPHYARMAAELQNRYEQAVAWKAQSDKPPSAFGILDEYAIGKTISAYKSRYPQLVAYGKRPETKTGAAMILTIKEGGMTRIKFPTLGPNQSGRYEIRIRAAVYENVPERFQYLEFTSGFGSNRNHLGWRKVTGTLDNPQLITFPLEHAPGERMNIWVHQRTHQDRGDKNLWTIDQAKNGMGTPPGIWVDWGEIVGPHADNRSETATSEILFAKPDDLNETQYATEVIRRFSTRAFRGSTPDPELLERLVAHYVAGRGLGKSQTQALIDPLSIVLASPSFLYMVEASGDKSTTELSDHELAARLSYFLWSGPPDAELLRVARSGRLSQPSVLSHQSSRLLADPRSDRFIRDFVHQWLSMDRLGMFQFDGVRFPKFDNAVREHAREEIFQTVKLLLDEKRPVTDLLKADYVVVNDLLADYYELPKVDGHEFRKVSVPPHSLRGGLLGTAAVLAMGSDGLRSSPVERGAWVLRHLINDPPPPAPPNVPQLSRLDGKILSARELSKAHQAQPQCAQCHQKIDPIGFALENFDASGAWRDLESITSGTRKRKKSVDFEIDPSGEMPDGTPFQDYHDLRDAVADHGDDFARGLTESLIEYGLGRPYGFNDQDLADEILRSADQNNNDLHFFIHALIQSKEFKAK